MNDIVERLRTQEPSYVLIGEAAIEIERLRAELERIADLSEKWLDSLISQINRIARDALDRR